MSLPDLGVWRPRTQTSEGMACWSLRHLREESHTSEEGRCLAAAAASMMLLVWECGTHWGDNSKVSGQTERSKFLLPPPAFPVGRPQQGAVH